MGEKKVKGIHGLFNKGKSYEIHGLTSGADPVQVSKQGLATLRRETGRLRPTSDTLNTSSGTTASKGLRRPGGYPTDTKHHLIIEVPKGSDVSSVSKPHNWKGTRHVRGIGTAKTEMNERVHASRIVGIYDRETDTVTPTARRVNKKRRKSGATRQKLAGLGASVAGLKILE